MKKKMVKTIALAGVLSLAAISPVLAGSTDEDVATLKRQVKLLIEQNQQLMKRVSELEKIKQSKDVAVIPNDSRERQASKILRHKETEKGKGVISAELPVISDEALERQVSKILRHKEKEKGQDADRAHMINKYIDFRTLIEVEASTGEDFEGVHESKFELATVELGFIGRVTDWASAHLTILYEEGGDDKVLIDDAHIIVGNTEKFPLYVNAGRQYVPFGHFTTNMISDPLTLEIAETQETALRLGFKARGAYGSVFAFNGDTNEGGGDSRIEQFGASAGYAFTRQDFSIDVGMSYINSMGDSDGLSEILKEDNLLEADYVGGFGAYAITAIGPISLIGEYITALDDFGNLRDRQPMAFNIETGYSFPIYDRESTVAIAYQGTNDMIGHLPESRILASFGIGIFEGTTLALEYTHDKDYSTNKGGSDNTADSFLARLAYEF